MESFRRENFTESVNFKISESKLMSCQSFVASESNLSIISSVVAIDDGSLYAECVYVLSASDSNWENSRDVATDICWRASLRFFSASSTADGFGFRAAANFSRANLRFLLKKKQNTARETRKKNAAILLFILRNW
jgi:hypothetical protein